MFTCCWIGWVWTLAGVCLTVYFADFVLSFALSLAW